MYSHDRLLEVTLPKSIMCKICAKFKAPAYYNDAQLNIARWKIQNRRDANVNKMIKCVACVTQYPEELKCIECKQIKGLDDFEKAERRNHPDDPTCQVCRYRDPYAADEADEDGGGNIDHNIGNSSDSNSDHSSSGSHESGRYTGQLHQGGVMIQPSIGHANGSANIASTTRSGTIGGSKFNRSAYGQPTPAKNRHEEPQVKPGATKFSKPVNPNSDFRTRAFRHDDYEDDEETYGGLMDI